jgi:hypothetical protein
LNDKEFFLKLAYYFLEGHSGENRCKLEMAWNLVKLIYYIL